MQKEGIIDDDRISHHVSSVNFVSAGYNIYYVSQCQPTGRRLSDNTPGTGAFPA